MLDVVVVVGLLKCRDREVTGSIILAKSFLNVFSFN